MSGHLYGMRITTILNAADKLEGDLEYLCSLVEKPVEGFCIVDAVAYAHAVMALTQQLDFIVEDLSHNELTEDEESVKLTTEELMTLDSYTDNSEAALKALEKICGISLQNN